MDKSKGLAHNDYDADTRLLSLWWGYVDESQNPAAILPKAFDDAIARFWYSILQYNDSRWLEGLREAFLEWVPDFYGIPRFPSESLLVTNGTTCAIDMVGRVLLHGEYDAATFEPCYDTAMQSLLRNARRVFAVPIDHARDGRLLVSEDVWDRLEEGFRTGRVKMFYLVPHFGNPTGMSVALEDRKRLLVLCEKYGVCLLEDDPYRAYNYGADPDVFPSLYELDTSKNTVIYANSVSKIGFPWLRIGYAVWPRDIIGRLAELQKYSTSSPNLLSQAVVANMVRDGAFERILKERIETMRRKYSTAVGFLTAHGLDKRMEMEIPKGGFFLWGKVPNDQDFVARARGNGLVTIPGSIYWHERDYSWYTRLTFAQIPESSLPEALERLKLTLDQTNV